MPKAEKRTHQLGDDKERKKKLARKESEFDGSFAKQVHGTFDTDRVMRTIEENLGRLSSVHPSPDFKHPYSIHAKLEISQPRDQAEVQADEVAESFVSGNVGYGEKILSHNSDNVSPTSDGNAGQTSDNFDRQLQSTKGQGDKLDEKTKSELEEHTGADLSDVKVHTGEEAHKMSQSINAKAFAHGQDIYFKEGQYNPKSEQGKELLAHEVAHTVQQGNRVQTKIQRQPLTDDPSVTGPRTYSEVKVDDKHPDLDEKQKESKQYPLVFDAALALLNGKKTFDVGENIYYPTEVFFTGLRLSAIINPPVGDYKGRPDAWFDVLGYLHVEADDQDGAITVASKWLMGIVDANEFYWNDQVLEISPTMAEAAVVYTRSPEEHLKYADKDPLLKVNLQDLENNLSRGLFDWVVTDEEVDDSLRILREAYKRNEYDFAWLVLQLKKDGLLGNLMRNIGSDHVAKYPDVIIRLSYLRETSELKDDVKKLVNDTIVNTLVSETAGVVSNPPAPLSGIFTRIGEYAEFRANMDPAETLGAFFAIKYYEIYSIIQDQNDKTKKKKVKKQLHDILMDVYEVVDFILEFLFSETTLESEMGKGLNEYIMSLAMADPFPLNYFVPGAGFTKWKPGQKQASLETSWWNKEGQQTDEKGVPLEAQQEVAGGNENTQPGSSNERRSPNTILVTSLAERAYWFFYNLGNLMATSEIVSAAVKEVTAETKKIQKTRLTKGVDLPKQGTILDDPGVTDLITWLDLAKIWFWELGSPDLNKIVFGATARTTKDIQQLDAVQKVIDNGQQRVKDQGTPEPFYAIVIYDTAAFKDSVKQRNIPMNFLGSFQINIDYINLANNAASIIVKVTNASTLESATRFRMRENPDKPSGPGNMNQPVLRNQQRDNKEVPLGGDLNCEWSWTVPVK
jgi:hypothetical protein